MVAISSPRIPELLIISQNDAFTFTPMIGSLVRGIYSILNVQLESPVDGDCIKEEDGRRSALIMVTFMVGIILMYFIKLAE